MDTERDLPWIPEADSKPEGVGICLSGGGLRAAYFALGAIQVLQQERGLLFGRRCADHLSVVSGGSYIGSTLILNAGLDRNEDDPAPLAEGTPEADHVLRRGRYLIEDGWVTTIRRFGWRGALNFFQLAALFAWIGVMMADFALFPGLVGWEDWLHPPDAAWAQGVLALVCLVAGGGALGGLYIDGGIARLVVWFVGLAVVLATAGSLIQAFDLLAGWWADLGWRWVAVVAGLGLSLVVLTYLSVVTREKRTARVLKWCIGQAAISVPRFVGLVLLSLIATWIYETLARGVFSGDSSDQATAAGIFFGALLLAPAFSYVAHRVSLHNTYRDLLSRCFAVQRTGDAATVLSEPTSASLSGTAPPPLGSVNSFPRLLISATANVTWRDNNNKRRNFAPFVFSHDRCGIPGVAGASYSTEQIEKGEFPSGPFPHKQPVLSLMSGVAATGAAVSPSMGRMTLPAVRPIIAILNLRLGRWLPNPFGRRARDRVASANEKWDPAKPSALGPGWDEFVPELLGWNRRWGARLYISDGGHYDNLGLLTLLRARCKTIWCVDAQADRSGEAKQLKDVIDFAREELGAEIDIDRNAFRRHYGTSNCGFVRGKITYEGGGEGTLIVVKLVLASSSPEELFRYKLVDGLFPHHPTFIQWYGFERAEAYRRLGEENTRAALNAVEVEAPSTTDPQSAQSLR